MNNQNKNVSVRAMENITTFEDGDPNENPWVAGQPKAELIEVQASAMQRQTGHVDHWCGFMPQALAKWPLSPH